MRNAGSCYCRRQAAPLAVSSIHQHLLPELVMPPLLVLELKPGTAGEVPWPAGVVDAVEGVRTAPVPKKVLLSCPRLVAISGLGVSTGARLPLGLLGEVNVLRGLGEGLAVTAGDEVENPGEGLAVVAGGDVEKPGLGVSAGLGLDEVTTPAGLPSEELGEAARLPVDGLEEVLLLALVQLLRMVLTSTKAAAPSRPLLVLQGKGCKHSG